MNILGFLGWASHDPGAAIIKTNDDGSYSFCTISEERLNRIKYSYHFPLRAVNYCMEQLGINSLDEIDLVVNDWSQDRDGFISNESFRRLEYDYIRKNLNIDKSKIKTIPSHHLAHAYTAFIPSGFDEAAILIVDAIGSELKGTSLYHGKGTKIKLIESSGTYSVGKLYDAITRVVLNFGIGEDGKTMGLAAFGENLQNYPSILNINGRYSGLNVDYSEFMNRIPDNGILKTGINSCKDKKQIYEPYYARIAFEVQSEAEKAMLHFAKYAKEKTGCKYLCIAGGVGLNCVANEKIRKAGLFDRVFIQPASSDAGVPLGCALYGYYETHKKSTYKTIFKNAYVGREYPTHEIEKLLRENEIPFKPTTLMEVARLLSEKNIIGWHSGGSEYGPRALGHRSILADPRHGDMKEILNKKVKHRELYRPFAPSVLEDYSNEYFDFGNDSSPFMLFAPDIHKEMRSKIPAVVHVDGTGRVQTVSRENCPEYYALISAFKDITGVPLILNTSFNDNDEPIVETPLDSLLCFLRTNIDYVVFNGKYLVKKAEITRRNELIEKLEKQRTELLKTSYKSLVKRFLKSYSVKDLKSFLQLHKQLSSNYKFYASYKVLFNILREHPRLHFIGDKFHRNILSLASQDLFIEPVIEKELIIPDELSNLAHVIEKIKSFSKKAPTLIGLYNMSVDLRSQFEKNSKVLFLYRNFNVHLKNVVAEPNLEEIDFRGIEDFSCEYNLSKDFNRMFKPE